MKILIQSEHYNEPCFVDLEGFEMVSQKIPTSWIITTKSFDDQLLVTMLPKSWTYDVFFDDVKDEKSEAVAQFNKEAEIIYHEEGKA